MTKENPWFRRHARNPGLTIFLLAISFSMSAQSAEFQGLIGDPHAAMDANYCEWAYGDRDSFGPMPDLASIMKDDDGVLGKRAVAAALLIDAGTKVAIAAKGRKKCKRELRKGLKVFDKTLQRNSRKFRKRGDFKASDDPGFLAIQKEIARLWVQDQAARVTYVALQTNEAEGAAYWARRLSVANAILADDEATFFMIATLESVDWIDSVRFGAPISRHAWILVQHADNHLKFQEKALLRMEKYLEVGGVRPRDYAYLWDRVAVNAGRLQRYGTQPAWECSDGSLTLQPMEDPDNVDVRRAEMDMKSAASALADMARDTCR